MPLCWSRRLVHEDITGNKGPTLEPVLLAQGHDVVGGGGVAPRMAWVPVGAGLNLAGTAMPLAGAAAPAPAAGPSTRGPPVSHGGYAGVVSGGHAPSPAESVGHEARARAASRCADRPRPPSVHAPSGSHGEERECSPKGRTALAAALAAAVVEAEAAVSTDAYMPDAAPEVDAGVRIASSAESAGLGDAVDEARIVAAAAAFVLRCVVDARGAAADVEAAQADADAAYAAAEAAAAAAAATGPVAAAAEAAATPVAPAEAAAAALAAGAAVASDVAAAAPAWAGACFCRSAVLQGRQGRQGRRGGCSPDLRRVHVRPSPCGGHPGWAWSCRP